MCWLRRLPQQPVITGMLGGSVACLAAYTLISSLAVAVFSPVIFSLLGEHAELAFGDSVFYICKQVMPLLVFPCVSALLLEKVVPAVHCQFKRLQILSFYLWALGLTIVTGKTVYFIVHQENADIGQEWWMAILALGFVSANSDLAVISDSAMGMLFPEGKD